MTSYGITSSSLPCTLYDVDKMKAHTKPTLDINMGDSNTFRFGEKRHRVRFKESMKCRDRLLRYPGVDDMLSSDVIRKEPLIPYEDNETKVNPEKYQQRGEKKIEVDEDSLEDFIGRVCLSAAMDERENYGIMDPYDGHVTNPENLLQILEDNRFDKRTKKDKKGKWNKKERGRKMVEEYLTTDNSEQSAVPTVTIPLREFRYLVNSEVESKARVIHDYYMYQWDDMQKDRIDAYRSLITWKDQFERANILLCRAKLELEKMTLSRDSLVAEIEGIKKNKRRRSGAKRRRTRELAARSKSSAQAQDSDFSVFGSIEGSQSLEEDCSR
ncbi:uncharacterized protein LOC110457179 [Mizuhopecten yessoensis]|uniref:Uncharacterized protein n=1 Tax=Mizuhopecten yessoensis TaxID=6573 RepID=A0A210Q9C0_MIZYE|nr:uncharacterized protein LOC110457179 [Mizuhopecten yessoensis]OWF45328.1 hypothetical protein KP79_PYT03635 [Mizuhopecten yessoensis]